jgi:hypothetical protein
MGLMILAGAHSKPIGAVLSFQGRLLYCGMVIFYAFIGWLLCSIIDWM